MMFEFGCLLKPISTFHFKRLLKMSFIKSYKLCTSYFREAKYKIESTYFVIGYSVQRIVAAFSCCTLLLVKENWVYSVFVYSKHLRQIITPMQSDSFKCFSVSCFDLESNHYFSCLIFTKIWLILPVFNC